MLRRSALLIIDMQQVFTDPKQPPFVADAPAALLKIQQVIAAFRAAHRPVAYTRHAHTAEPKGPGMGAWWSSFVMDGSPASLLDPTLRPTPDELVLRKEHYSAFRQTHLESWLRSANVDTVVLTGTMTHICVDTTARDAFMTGFDVVVVTDACASKHPALHESALQGLSHAVARLTNTQALIAGLEAMR